MNGAPSGLDRLDSSEFWDHVFPAQQPVVWRNATAGLPLHRLVAMGRAELLDELRSTAGKRVVTVSEPAPGADGRLGYSPSRWKDWSERTATLDSFLSCVEDEREDAAPRTLYVQATSVERGLPELQPLVPTWANDARMLEAVTQLWIGSGGQRVAIHRDQTHSLIYMIAGTKELSLFPPDQLPNLYVSPEHSLFAHPWRSAVDPREPDLRRFPRFAQALESVTHIRLNPGDVLFLPAFWWHGVDSHGFNAMMNTRWFDVPEKRRFSKVAVFCNALLTARDLPAQRREFLRNELRRWYLEGAVPDKAERESSTEALRPRFFEDGPLPGPTLRASREVDLQLDEAGACFEHRQSGRVTRLSWDYLPLVEYFAVETTLAEALAALEEDYAADRESIAERVRELVAGGVLVADSASDAERVARVAAHAALSIPGLPAYYRHAAWADLDHFGFSTDPYPHVAPSEQGLLGLPLQEEAAHRLRSLVERDIAIRFRRGGRRCEAERAYRLNRHRRFVAEPEGLTCRGPGGYVLVSWDQADVLGRFAASASIDDIVRASPREYDRDDLEALVSTWIESGILEPDPAS